MTPYIHRLVLAGTTPDERAMIAATEWSRAKQALYFATCEADRHRADADRVAALGLYRHVRSEARATG